MALHDYKVEVQTGSARGSGTDAEVNIQVRMHPPLAHPHRTSAHQLITNRASNWVNQYGNKKEPEN